MNMALMEVYSYTQIGCLPVHCFLRLCILGVICVGLVLYTLYMHDTLYCQVICCCIII